MFISAQLEIKLLTKLKPTIELFKGLYINNQVDCTVMADHLNNLVSVDKDYFFLP